MMELSHNARASLVVECSAVRGSLLREEEVAEEPSKLAALACVQAS